MKKQLLEILACPVCKGELELSIYHQSDEEIISGQLRCKNCDQSYPIEDGIPNLLPPEQR